ncbi:unnamed protein product [Lactuca virosa]|uniref:PHD-type domain-containing protein n=1 Tax=Lactuca virosa TaxID=75947 RepID=A0AAU9MQS7_9ASTR|nr:unnamed protein product [Lactuca virosa]
MDNTVVGEPMDLSEMRSETVGEKRPLENGVDRDSGIKKAKGGGVDVGLASNVKKVAEIVLVLATMGKMRGGRKPTAVEVQMMAEAREKLADVCKEFAPKDIFPRDAFGSVIEDLGLNRLREQRLGIRPPKMSIAEKLQLTKQKMEKSEVFPLHSNMYTPPRLQSNISGATENRGASVRMFPSDKTNHTPVSSGSFQNPSNVVHASASNTRALPYQLPTSEVRPGVSNIIHMGRDSSLSVPRAERPHFRIDGGANGSYNTSQSQGKTPSWSMQPQAASFGKAGSDKVKADGSSSHVITSKPFITQGTPTPMNTNHVPHRMNFIQPPSVSDTHSEVSKIVQKLLHPHLPDHPTWTPPSRDYMTKALTCQMCKGTINDVDTVLVCDACERGYHLRCLHCNPKSIPRGEWQEWHCAKCLTISNGKPLPPKYGRVMRNISTPKLSSNTLTDQPSLDKKSNGISDLSQTASGETNSKLTEVENEKHDKSCLVERSNEEKFAMLSAPQPPANLEAVTSFENHHTQTQTQTETDALAQQSQNSSDVQEVSHSGQQSLEPGVNGSDSVKEEGEEGDPDPVKKSETHHVVVGENEDPLLSSIAMNEVEWVGDVVKEIDGKTYYQSCCINGTSYALKDYALFSSPGNKYLPNKLQEMWEDEKTKKKCVTVTRCFFPDDLPEGVGRPCAPETNEVYESNHESTLLAGLIHGPCEVLPPSKFSEENAVRTRLRARGSDRRKPLFLCKWFYDEIKRLFRDVTC